MSLRSNTDAPEAQRLYPGAGARDNGAAIGPGAGRQRKLEALARRFRNFEAFRLALTTRGKSGPTRGTGPPGRAAAA